MAETTVTTATITALRLSKRSAHCALRSPVSIQVKRSTAVRAWPPTDTSTKRTTPQIAASTRLVQVTSCAPRSPIQRPKNPAMNAPKSGRKTAAMVMTAPYRRTTASDPPPFPPPQGGRRKARKRRKTPSPLEGEGWGGGYVQLRSYASALHQVDVFDGDGAAVAEVDDEDGEADRCLGGRDGEHEHGEDLADEIVETQTGREGDEVDVDGEQHQLDRHQHDDDVLAIEEDAEDAEREDDGGKDQVMGEADIEHRQEPV